MPHVPISWFFIPGPELFALHRGFVTDLSYFTFFPYELPPYPSTSCYGPIWTLKGTEDFAFCGRKSNDTLWSLVAVLIKIIGYVRSVALCLFSGRHKVLRMIANESYHDVY